MSRTIQVRHVPDALHRKLKARAAREGFSLSDYLLREIEQFAERPTLAELRRQLARLSPVVPPIPSAQAVREARNRG